MHLLKWESEGGHEEKIGIQNYLTFKTGLPILPCCLEVWSQWGHWLLWQHHNVWCMPMAIKMTTDRKQGTDERNQRQRLYKNRLLQCISTYMNPLIFTSALLEWCRPPHRSQSITSSLLCTPHWPCRHSNHLYLTSLSVRRFWVQIIVIGHFYSAFFISTNH